MTEYKGIYYGSNPYAQGEGQYQDLLGMDNEPAIIIYTPDIECYADTPRRARTYIDRWIERNGDVESFRQREDAKVFGVNLKLV